MRVAGPALAAPSFEPSTVVAGQRAHFAVRVPVEGQGTNLRLIVQLIQGFVVDGCPNTSGWRCRIVLATQPPRTVLTYEWADAGAAPSSNIVTFVARTPPTSATLRLEVDQFYVDGHVVYWGGSTNKPAATLTLVDAPATTAAAPASTASPPAFVRAPQRNSDGSVAVVLVVVIATMLGVVVPVARAGMRDRDN
jgi:uncharacterized protein YcnI